MTNRPNALLCGPPSTIDAALAALEPYFPQPVVRWSADNFRSLPCRARGTVILEHAEAYEQEQQRALLKWLDEARVQVVSTTDRPLVDLVERGLFLDHLYYRLNTVYLDLGC